MTTHAGYAATSTAYSPVSEPTVVICAYTSRRWPMIVRAVRSARTQRTAAERVVLVIDHNPALLARAAAAFPGVTVVPNAGPRGLSGARDTGVAHAGTEIVAFLDDDAEADGEWLARLTRLYADPDVVAAGGAAVPDWETGRPRWLPPEFDWVVGCAHTGLPRAVAPVRNLIGCNMSFRRDALLRAGGFDPALGRVGGDAAGCEETELCIRLRGTVLYDPAAAVRHRVPAERGTWRYFRRRCAAEGRSKAVVAQLAGAGAALSAERDYVRHTLPRAFWRSLTAGRLRQAGAVVAGLAITAGAYLVARAGYFVHKRPPPPERVLAVDLEDGIPAVPADDRYAAARVLVRVRGEVLGVLRTDLPPGGLTAPALSELIRRQLGWEIDHQVRRAPAETPFASVVVPTCGRETHLRQALASLTTLDYPHYEIVVVDNRPERPGTAGLVASYGPRVRYVAEPRHGVAYARNRGLAEATGEIVAFADDDVVVDQWWLRSLVDRFADAGVAAVTGHVLARELETPAQLWIERYGGFGKGCLRRRFDASGYETVERGRVRRVAAAPRSLYPYLPGTYGTGANVAFRTGVLRALGGFDPVLGSPAAVPAGEDIDVLMRLVLAGHALAYEPSAIVWHAHKRELRALRRTIYAYGVGLGAVMAKSLVTADRVGRRELIRRLPRGIVYAFWPRSPKNAGKRDGYPASLTALELCGMALGLAYYAWAVCFGSERARS
ncbi:glycosyltransferase [Phytohabitans sp. LJ34]|uniref:glycosyltransferase n=1 Tax=Phytohabitans sp. LJ34 TaxID=3452217 RepID=UPI003F89BFFD